MKRKTKKKVCVFCGDEWLWGQINFNEETNAFVFCDALRVSIIGELMRESIEREKERNIVMGEWRKNKEKKLN